MALKMSTEELQCFIPECEQENKVNQSKVWAVPLNAKGYERYTDAMVEARGGKIKSRAIRATEDLIRDTVKKLENFLDFDGTLLPETTNSEKCVGLLMGLKDVNAYNEIMNWLKGISVLSEEELKNSAGPQEPDSSGQAQKPKKAQ